jgi:hypothetical protein
MSDVTIVQGDEKNAKLALRLKAQSGYNARADYEVSADQWSDILAICEGKGRQASTEDMQHRLDMIVSHATSGHTDGAGMSVNDICVEISRTRNHVYQAGKDVSAKATDDLVEALRGLEPYLDAIVCFASTQGEHEPNRLVANARTALNKAGAL